MLIAFTQTTHHLRQYCSLPQLIYTLHTFSDNEIELSCSQEIKNEIIWIVTATNTAQSFLELFFLIDLCRQKGAQSIHIAFSYFGYARQTQEHKDHFSASLTLCTLLKNFPIDSIIILHPHSPLLHNFLAYKDYIDYSFFYAAAHTADIIIAPDAGACALALHIAQHTKKQYICLDKKRSENDTIYIKPIEKSILNKKVLIVDDIIVTGNTALQAAHVLMQAGATIQEIAVTHNLAEEKVIKKLSEAFNVIYTTNSIAQHSPLVSVHNVYNTIEETIKSPQPL